MHKEQVYRSTVASPSEFENEQGQNFFLCFKKRKIFASMKKHKKRHAFKNMAYFPIQVRNTSRTIEKVLFHDFT